MRRQSTKIVANRSPGKQKGKEKGKLKIETETSKRFPTRGKEPRESKTLPDIDYSSKVRE